MIKVCFCFFLLIFNHLIFGEKIDSLPFKVGEKLEYDLSWGFIPVGKATMEIHSRFKEGNESFLIIKFFVRTNSFADSFYRVRTTIESKVAEDFSKSFSYRKSQEEGSTKKQILVEFNYDTMQATYIEDSGLTSKISIPGFVFDPLAIAYSFRTKNLKENQKIRLPTCDGKSFRSMIVDTGKRKNISVPAGKFTVIETRPEMKNLKGVFKKSPEGILRVWYSTGNSRLPVKISSKVVVGSFNAKLTKVSFSR